MQPLTLAACDFLSSPAAQAELAGARLPAKSEELGFLSRARARFGADEAGWLLDQLQLRARVRRWGLSTGRLRRRRRRYSPRATRARSPSTAVSGNTKSGTP